MRVGHTSVGRRPPGRRRNAAFGVLAAVAALIVFPALAGADATNPPVVTTDPATGVTNTSATLNGTIDPNDPDTGAGYTFSWGETTAYGNNVSGTTSPGTTPQSVSKTLTGLAPRTTYHYKLCATNAPAPPGGTTCDSDQSFPADAPTVVAGDATGVTDERRDSSRDGQPERRHGHLDRLQVRDQLFCTRLDDRLLCGHRITEPRLREISGERLRDARAGSPRGSPSTTRSALRTPMARSATRRTTRSSPTSRRRRS